MAGNPSPEQWAATLLDQLGIPQSPGAIQALVGWEHAEGGHWNNSAKFNPLNTTQPEPGSQTFRSVGQGAADIRIYDSWDQGVDATVKTLRNGRYGGIIQALKAGDPNAVAKAIDQSPWGTHGSYLYSAISGTKPTTAQPFSTGDASGSPSSGTAADPAAVPTSPGLPGASDFTGVLGQLLAKPQQQQPASQPVAPPSFAAAPKLPQGFSPASSAPVAQEGASGVSGLLDALRASAPTDGASGGLGVAASVSAARAAPGVAGTVQAQRASGGTGKISGVIPLGGSKNAGQGAFTISGPDPGRLKPELTSFANKVAYVYGGSMVGKDGSTHSKYTVNGNVSEHYTGNATDIFEIDGKPAQGATLLRAGRAALIAAGMPRAEALKATGGLYNVGNHQIIFLTNEGGDHYDHLHISTHAG